MQQKILSKRVLLIATASGVILLGAFLFNFILKKTTNGSSVLLVENVAAFSKHEPERSGLPLRLKIPSIKVDASVEYLGLTLGGAMDVPKGPVDVAWFNLGPRPGEKGMAVIAGHEGWQKKIPAVFDNLHKVKIGDKISIEDENKLVTIFVVRKIQVYSKNDKATEVFTSADGKVHLNLITCTGTWNKVEKTRSERLVVFADKE